VHKGFISIILVNYKFGELSEYGQGAAPFY